MNQNKKNSKKKSSTSKKVNNRNASNGFQDEDKKTKVKHATRRTITSFIYLIAIIILINIAPNYIKEARTDDTKLVINNNNITKDLKSKIVYKDDKYYLSTDDLKNFFDEFLINDANEIITTSSTKTVRITKGLDQIYENGSTISADKTIEVDGKTFVSFDNISNIYNLEYSVNKENNVISVDSLSKKLVQATSKKNQYLKYKATSLSKNLQKVKRGDIVTIVQNQGNNVKIGNFIKVRTSEGLIGYLKIKDLIGEKTIREDMEYNNINEKISLVWDYYSPYSSAPTRTKEIDGVNAVSPSFYELKADSSISKNVSEEYITWAHNNNYKIWPTLSNSFLNNLDAVSGMMKSFDTRAKLIDNIVKVLTEDDVDGINIDFENMYKEDKDNYSRFIIELTPRLREIGKTVLVDVTEPDGSDNWSLCYDRNTLGKVADFIVFIAYDQHNASSKVAGSVASYDWIELNIKKFLGQEGISSDKLILAIPFYTRLWKEKNGNLTSSVVNMNDITIPKGVQKEWIDSAKQYYFEYNENNTTYKMWVEDSKSISNKLDLVNNYKLKGAGFWEKDRETSEVWSVIKEKLGL